MKKQIKKETSFHAGKQVNEASNKEKGQAFSNKVYHKRSFLSIPRMREFIANLVMFILTVLMVATVVICILTVTVAVYWIMMRLCFLP